MVGNSQQESEIQILEGLGQQNLERNYESISDPIPVDCGQEPMRENKNKRKKMQSEDE